MESKPSLPGAEIVLAAFADLSISYSLKKHQPVKTCEDQASELRDLEGFLTKNLFFKDKKSGYYLITVRDSQAVDAKTLGKRIKTKNLRLAPDEELEALLGVARGSVTPLAIMNDVDKKVTLILDAALVSKDASNVINVHPLQCDQTVSITAADLLKFAEKYEHTPVMIDFEASVASAAAPKKTQGDQAPKGQPKTKTKTKKPEKKEKETKSKEGISFAKASHFADWYTEVITKSGLIDYYDISGCYILRPWSYSIWEHVQGFLDAEIKKLGVKNCYFPMFVSQEKLAKEENHLEGFAAEVAWVTKSGTTDLKEPIAIRPTSETIMYPAFKNWIRSHRDLPLKLNQWNNVVRWEFKNPTPFIRTREFLWQEGHTVHETQAEADVEVLQVLDFYARAYAELLAVPMIKGHKSAKEKFAGALYTTTIEGFIPATGRGIQAATSHALGLNFGKMFGISAENECGEKFTPTQNSWGFTTRSLGVMIMIHGDDQGLVLPPRVAPVQVVIIPILLKEHEADDGNARIVRQCRDLAKVLHEHEDNHNMPSIIRTEVDDRTIYTPGWKYNHWEVQGVPLRLEVGPRDLALGQVTVVRRDTRAKTVVLLADVATVVPALLEKMQHEMLLRATVERDAHIKHVNVWSDFVPALQEGNLILTPFCNEVEWEERVKDRSREESLALAGEEAEAENVATSAAAKSLCLPFEHNQEPIPEGTKCFISGQRATCYMLWGRSY